MKPTIRVKLHRFNNSPYALGPAGTYAAEVLYVRGVYLGRAIYNGEGRLLSNHHVLPQSRVAASDQEAYELLEMLRRHYNVVVVNKEYPYEDTINSIVYVDKSVLVEQL